MKITIKAVLFTILDLIFMGIFFATFLVADFFAIIIDTYKENKYELTHKSK